MKLHRSTLILAGLLVFFGAIARASTDRPLPPRALPMLGFETGQAACPVDPLQDLTRLIKDTQAVSDIFQSPTYAITDKDIRASACRSPLSSREKILAYFKKPMSETPSSRDFFGLKIVDNESRLNTLDQLFKVAGKFTLTIANGRTPDSPQLKAKKKVMALFKNYPQKNFTVSQLLTSLFGTEQAALMVYAQEKYALILNPVTDGTDRATPLATGYAFLHAVELYPPHLQKKFAANLDLVVRNQTADFYDKKANPKWATSANPEAGEIFAYPPCYRFSSDYQESFFVHEVGHLIADQTPVLDTSTSWLSISGWSKTGDPRKNDGWISARPLTTVSTYAATTPHEDFAESVMTYRYAPQKLRQTSIEKYNFIRDRVFNGIEYTSEKSCREIKPKAASK